MASSMKSVRTLRTLSLESTLSTRGSSEQEASRHYGEQRIDVDTSPWGTRPKRRKRYALKDHGHGLGERISHDSGTDNNGGDVQALRGEDPTIEVKNGEFDGHDTAAIKDLRRDDCL